MGMKVMAETKKVNNWFIYLYIVAVAVTGAIQQSMLNPIDGAATSGMLNQIAKYVPYVMSLIGILSYALVHKTRKQFIIAVSSIAMMLYAYRIVNSQSSLLIICLFIIFSTQMRQDELLRLDFLMRIGVVVTVFAINLLHITNNGPISSVGPIVVYSLGFRQKNILGMYLMIIGIEYIIMSKKSRRFNVFFGIFETIAIFLVSNSLGATIAVLFFSILTIFDSKRSTKLPFWGILAFPVFATLSVWVSFFLDVNSKLFVFLNQFLTGRPYLLRLLYFEYPNIKIFGQPLTILSENTFAYFVGRHRLYADNQYVYDLLAYGLFGLFIHFLISTVAIIFASRKKNLKIMLWIIALAAYEIVERKALTLELIIPIMLAFSLESKSENEVDYD